MHERQLANNALLNLRLVWKVVLRRNFAFVAVKKNSVTF